MKPIAITLLLLGILVTGHSQMQDKAFTWLEASPKMVVSDEELQIPVVDFNGLQPLFEQSDGKIRVVNFWATWCAPCIAELPYLEEINNEYASQGVEVILVSLDLRSMWKERLPSFIRKKQLQSPVIILDDPDQNAWIPKVDPDWSGAIPATLIYSGAGRRFYETAFDRQSLKKAIDSFIH